MSTNNERITAAIQAMLTGDVPSWRRPWRTLRDNGASTMPRNALTGRAYRGVNVAILWGRQDADMRYLTFNQARAHGGTVRRGEHGEQVTFWQKRTYKDKATGEDRQGLVLRLYTVFNLSQCAGVELPKPREAPAPLAPPPVMTEVCAAVSAVVQHGGDRAFYAPGPDHIGMPVPEAFSTPDGYSATLLHELTHWTGHKSRLDREFGKRFGTHAYAAEELVAELGSAFLCAELGIDSALEHHASYIDSWRSLKSSRRWRPRKAASHSASTVGALADAILQPPGQQHMPKPKLLDTHSDTLRTAARRAGELVARKLFSARGNHSEVHLNEYELAIICATAADIAITLRGKRV